MRLKIQLAAAPIGYVRVELGRGEVGVAEHLLDAAQVAAIIARLQPPSADWALMISENRTGIAIQPWAVAMPAIFLGLLTVAVNLSARLLSDRQFSMRVAALLAMSVAFVLLLASPAFAHATAAYLGSIALATAAPV